MQLDPRAKMLPVCLLTSLAIIRNSTLQLLILLILALLLSMLVSADLSKVFSKLRIVLSTFLGILIIQLLFNRSGEALLTAGNRVIVTDTGLETGLGFFLRMLIILLCGAALATSNSQASIQSLIQLKLPYTLAFMVITAISFIPMLAREVNHTLIALQLRGINIKKIPVRQKVKTFTYLFFPVIMQTLDKAQALSIALDLRGFRSGFTKTSRMKLKLRYTDWLVIIASSLIFLMVLLIV